MSKTSYVLSHNGSPVAIVNAESNENLKEKVSRAIKEEVCAEPDGQFELTIGRIGDWGEDINIKTAYVNDGYLINDDDFVLTKLVSY
jgi:hypothetical protein